MHFSATYQLIENSSFGNLKPFLDKKHIPPCLCMSENVKSFTKSPRLTVLLAMNSVSTKANKTHVSAKANRM